MAATSETPRVVFDCMIFVQAALNGLGTCGACFQAARDARLKLQVSPYVIGELKGVLTRPRLRGKFSRLNDTFTKAFVEEFVRISTMTSSVPAAYRHPLDPKDEPYVNLAIASRSSLIVSRDARHTLALMDVARPEGKVFRAAFPSIEIVTPERLLSSLRSMPTE